MSLFLFCFVSLYSFLYLWKFSVSVPVVQKSGWSCRHGICAVLQISTLRKACVQCNALLSPFSSSFTYKATYTCTEPCQSCSWSCHCTHPGPGMPCSALTTSVRTDYSHSPISSPIEEVLNSFLSLAGHRHFHGRRSQASEEDQFSFSFKV